MCLREARANGLPSCVIIIRILRDLSERAPALAALSEWAIELLVEKCISTGGPHMPPGDSLRRVLECIASGILLPDGPGLYDPCEKEPTDLANKLTDQQREDITKYSQHTLRLIAFHQIHKVLDMEKLKIGGRRPNNRFNNRKRRLPGNTGEDQKDKIKKDDENAAKKDDENAA